MALCFGGDKGVISKILLPLSVYISIFAESEERGEEEEQERIVMYKSDHRPEVCPECGEQTVIRQQLTTGIVVPSS